MIVNAYVIEYLLVLKS